MAADIRPALDPIFATFGVAATVTPPYEEPIATTAIWHTPLMSDMPLGEDFKRREPIKVLELRKDEVPSCPLATRVVAPELLGGVDRIWRVDGFVAEDAECRRVTVTLDPDDDV